MKKIFIAFFVVLVSNVYSQISNYDVGDTVNNFLATDIDGNSYDLYNLLDQGKYVYIDFFASNCGTCQTKLPIFNKFYSKYGCNQGDVFCISISVRSNDYDREVIDFEQNYGGSGKHAPAVSADGGAQNIRVDFGVLSYPTFCVIAPDHTMIVENINNVNSFTDFSDTFPQDFDPPMIDCTNSIEDNNSTKPFKIYPNPSINGIFNISFNDKKIDIMLTDINGNIVFFKTKIFNNCTLKTKLSSGIYFIKLISNNDIYIDKLIVQ